jgi:transglutaminase-like putative cysteine protease
MSAKTAPVTESWTRPGFARRLAAREREVRDTLWLLAAIVWILVPLAWVLPVWTSLSISAVLVWRVILTWEGRRLPPRLLVFALMLAAGIAVFLQFHSIFGKDAGVAYVVLLLGLKLLELKARRDTFVVIFLCLFIMLTSLFDSQSIGTAIWLCCGVLWLVTALVRTNLLGREPLLAAKVKLAGQITLLALPLTAVIFLFFPRVEGPLWGMPADAFSSRSGLGDVMAPGSLEKLVQSNALAFEVQFEGRTPSPAERYWRGPVLGSFDGFTWRPLPFAGTGALEPLQLQPDEASSVRYTVTVEPTFRNALYLLDAPAEIPRAKGFVATLKPDLQVGLQSPLRERVRFEARSYSRFRYGQNASVLEREEWLRLPVGLNPKTHAFATRLRSAESDDSKLIARVLDYIRTENFVYSTTAPRLGRNGIDEFLFETRRGFCEHYASAFVVLMRAMGIPARVVTGYQGGDINPINGYMTIRQKDAHAWAEVWLADKGWTRVDPTAAVAPERILQGSDESLAGNQDLGNSFLGIGGHWVRWVRYNIEAINNDWNQWVISYSEESQRSMFAHLGMPDVDWGTLTIALIAGSALVLALLGGAVILKRPRPEPVVALYLKLCDRLGKRGAKRRPSEGPRDYFARVAPDLAEPERSRVRDAFSLYEQLRYAQNAPTAERLNALRACIKDLGS